MSLFATPDGAGDPGGNSPLGSSLGALGSTRPKPAPEVLARVREWVRAELGVDEEIVITVNEIRCPMPDCPDIETIIGVLLAPRQIRKLNIIKPLAEVTREDVHQAAVNPPPPKHGE